MKQIIEIIKEEFNLDIDEQNIATSSDLYQFCKENQVEGTLIAWMYKKGKLWYDTAEKYEIDEKLINYDTSLKNYLKAAIYENLAALGDAKFQYILAQMYEEGKGTLPDYQKAILWYEEAIKNNFVEAELFYRLGNLYDKGLGTTPNKEKAKQLIEKALEMGYKPEE